VSSSIRCCVFSFSLILAFATVSHADDPLPERVQFNRDIRPILSDVCFQCHGPDQNQRKGNLRFDTEAGAFADLGDGRHAIVANRPDQSELIARIESTDLDVQMPPKDLDRPLTSRQKSLLRRWVEQGAKWDAHWSFVKPVQPKCPKTLEQEWSQSPLDTFIAAKREQAGLAAASPAEKSTLLRRVTLDLTGLPPTPDQVNEFLADTSPDTYERVVDRLLASPHYGERMAVRWLNGARYADTSGYQSDGERIMWRWRDWVIDAFNANQPFDQFTIEQIAGDMLTNPTLEQRIATGFNRNHRGNAEGGIIPEEYAVEYVVDRVETTSTVWLGLTAMCARCHNHKYDPITQRDFYQLFAFFNNLPEKGRALKYGNSPPLVVSPTRDQQRELAQLEALATTGDARWRQLAGDVAKTQAKWEQGNVPDIRIANVVRHRLALSFAFDGDCGPQVSVPIQPARPSGYLGQTRLLAPPPPAVGAPVETGNPQFAAGRFGQALSCDDQNYAVGGDVANFGFFDRFSISAWINPQAKTGGTIVSRMTDVPHGDGWCVVLEQGKLQVHLTKRWLDDACRVETRDAIDMDHWHNVTVTYDGTREVAGIRIYLDGVVQPLVTLLDELNQSFENKGPLRIGGGNGPEGRFHGLIDDLRIFDRVLTDEEAQLLAQASSLRDAAVTPSSERSSIQTHALRYYFVRYAAPVPIGAAWIARTATQELLSQFRDELPSTMVMEDLSSARDAFILIRGEYDKRGEKVSANVPASLPSLPTNAPANRLSLANWIVGAENPLTARVAVNRLWQMLFGTGLVKTIDDFGLQGEWPSHPELLDWLAVEFQSGPGIAKSAVLQSNVATWDIKRTLRMLTTSATYRQSSRTTESLQQQDPENRLLARGPRLRLSAEMVRDQALAASGLLVEQLGGPSVKPYQPDGLWKDLAGLDYEQDHGASLYRRSLYIYWKRTVAPPSMITFDAAGRETCIVKETRTNTPLQALNLMNDVTYVEAARHLAQRMLSSREKSTRERINTGFQLLLGRVATDAELAVLTAGITRHLSYYEAHPQDADTLTKQGESPRDANADLPELAAWTTIAGLILNLDEAVMRE